MRRLVLMCLCLLVAAVASAQPPTPSGIPETKQWEDWNKARPVIPAPPILLSPANGATNVPINTPIQVQSIGAQRLDWRYGTSSRPPLIANQAFSYTPTNQLYSTKYTIQVRGVNPQGQTTYVTWSYTTGPKPNPPTITCPAGVQVTTNTNAPAPVTWAAPIVSGGQPPVESYVCTPASGSAFPIGMSSSTCSVKDAANQTAMCTIPITVTYTPPQPIESPIGWRVPRDGPTVTTDAKVIWSLGPDNQCGAGFPHPEWCRQLLNNGILITNGFGFEYEWNVDPLVAGSPKTIYVRGDDAHWYYPFSPVSCTQGQPCQASWIYYGDVAPSEVSLPLPPACRDGIDNDGDGKIDFNPPPGKEKDPGCQSPDWPSEADTPMGPLAAADHDGVQYSYVYNGQTYTLPLLYRIYLDGQMVKEQPRSEVWNGGHVVMSLPTGVSSGTHVVEMSAVFLCATGTPGCGMTTESPRSMPPVEWQVP